MVSISPPKSAGMGSSYFDTDSYYAHNYDTSKWYGNGADKIGLSGAINKKQFEYVLDGFDTSGKALVNNAGTPDTKDEKGNTIIGRRAYVDMTFSAPKSVSLLSYVDNRIEEAHNRAVEKAIKEVEKEYAHTRKSENGEINTVKSDNLIMARFNHHESRELDPQLHSHIVVMNLTKCEDNKWRAIETGDIYKNQMYIGQVYRNELAKEIKELGYKIEVTDRKKGFYEIKGIDKDIRDEFSTRRRQVEESKKKYEDYNVSDAKKAEYACLDSRRDKHDNKVDEIRQKVEEKLEKHDLTLETLKEKSFEQKEKEKTPETSAKECIEMAIEEVTDKQSGFRKEEVLNLAMKAGLGEHTSEELKTAFESKEEIKELGTQAQFAGRTQSSEATFYTTDDLLKTESGIIKWAKEGRETSEIAVSDEKVKAHLEKIGNQEKPIRLSEGQREALEMICTTKDRLSIVQGDAGAGKSFACEQVKAVMEEGGYTVRGFAPTGKASVELSKAGIETKTVDSFLESAALGKTGTGQKELWIVDEAGMMGSRKTEQFLKEAEKHEAKVVLIGDTKQFQSVNQGKIFSDLQEHAGVAKAEIIEVKRQQTAHAKEIVAAIKEKDFDKVFSLLDDNKSLKEVKNGDERLKQISDEYIADKKNGTDTMVLSSTNKDKDELNTEIRSRLVKAGAVESGKSYITHQKSDLDAVTRKFADAYQEGQKVVFTKDTGDIKRGTQGEITGCDTDKNKIHVKYWDKESAGYKNVSLDCKKQSGKIETYNPVEKNFGKGDRIIFQKNDDSCKVKNGEIGTIKSIDKNGKAVVGIGDEKKPKDYKDYKEVEVNLYGNGKTGYTNCDHAYSITSHKSQGATVDKVIINSEASKNRSSFNEFYVQATRERKDISVYTNDKELLKKQVQIEQNKASTLGEYGELKVDFSKHEKAIAQNSQDMGNDKIPFISADKRKEKVNEPQQAKSKENDRGMEI